MEFIILRLVNLEVILSNAVMEKYFTRVDFVDDYLELFLPSGIFDPKSTI